jgi:hypothetical protein
MSRSADTVPSRARQTRIGSPKRIVAFIAPDATEELVKAGYQNPNKGAFLEGCSSVIASVAMLREKEDGESVMPVPDIRL